MASLQHNHESLQELAKELKLVVPDRYVQEQQESTFVSEGSLPLPSIPLIDLKDLINMQESDIEQWKNLRSICHEWGIFQLVNHGVDKLLVEKLKKEVVEFYKLPMEEKLRYKLKAGEYEGYGQTVVNTQDQKVDWADRFYMITNPLHRRKSHLLPQLPPTLRSPSLSPSLAIYIYIYILIILFLVFRITNLKV
ncbi:putative codeine 3-O-demethylase [Helianthus annuus]|nr:putative codeine 3-O-demethylase [Helianthus annuus]KAJ0589531.1 putative codeine 3-O-demethylase [Helianthus annuus]KAJ0597505.1 putative codeine 3-O-demethylase [Helianthus annuus]KAJ0758154.1 putative codeine 3-O-demethylase [Helianthus annuus]